MAAQTHLVNKTSINEHVVVDVDIANVKPLAPGNVRIKPKIVSLSRNNVSYAVRGTLFKWWDTYPLSPEFPSPYNDGSLWGIVPAWGYGEVVETTVSSLQNGRLLYGFWPTSSAPTDLQLEQDPEYPLLFKEKSPYRQPLMTLYNDYLAIPEDGMVTEEQLGWKPVAAVWASGYVLANYVFNHNSHPVHPLGSGQWTVEDSDLRSSLVIALSASSATSRSMVWNLRQRAAVDAPKAILEVSSDPTALTTAHTDTPPKFQKVATYNQVTDPAILGWIIDEVKPQRVVIFDFGGQSGLPQRLHDAIFAAAGPGASLEFLYVAIGSRLDEVKVEEPHTKAVQSNMSGQRDTILGRDGVESYQTKLDEAWMKWFEAKAWARWNYNGVLE